jgi:hypothetical protein
MKRWFVPLLTIALLAGAETALAGGRGGHGHFGRSSGAFVAVHPGFVRPGFVHSRPFFHHGGRVIVGSAIVVGAVGYPYYYPYYPPAYVPPAYVEEPPVTYVEQAAPAEQVLYYCPDSRAYYPGVTTCPSPWLKVVP